MNENDSERIAGLLAGIGARPAASEEDADIIVVNTCAVRAKSVEKLHSYLGRLRLLKRARPRLIGIAGCVAQIESERLLEKPAVADFVVGPDNYLRFPEILRESLGSRVVETALSREWRETPAARGEPQAEGGRAYVTIMEGCDNFCAYCIVPFARGREKHRPLASILAEVEDLVRGGYKEIQLLGQNVNRYRDPQGGADFPALLSRVAGPLGPEWVRFLTSHPRDLSQETVAAMAASARICRQIHLPLQSGSASVLARMNRGYSRTEYLERIAWLRGAMPEISITTDIIVGFPGESEADFRETLSALELIRFAAIYSFRYSPRPGTAAALLADDVPLETKRRRLIEVQSLQKEIQTAFHRSLIGRTQKVLASGPARKEKADAFQGRNAGGQVVNFTSETDVAGRFVEIEITGAGPYSLRGRLLRA